MHVCVCDSQLFEVVNIGEAADENVSELDFDEFLELVGRLALLLFSEETYRSSHTTAVDKICALVTLLDSDFTLTFDLTMQQEVARAKRKGLYVSRVAASFLATLKPFPLPLFVLKLCTFFPDVPHGCRDSVGGD